MKSFPHVEPAFDPYERCALCGVKIANEGVLVVGIDVRFVAHQDCLRRVSTPEPDS